MKNKNHYIGLLFFLLLALGTSAQTSNWTIEGTVSDEYGVPVAGASILTDGQLRTTSEASGRFSVVLPKRPSTLSVKRLGFVNYLYRLDTAKWAGQRIELNLFLMSDNPQLKEVVISANPIQTVFEEDFSHELLDYTFIGGQLLLLEREKKQHYLRFATDDHQVLSELALPNVGQYRLFVSCTGSHHIVGTEAVWEIALSNNVLDTFPRYAPKVFFQLVEPCQVAVEDHYFYRRIGPMNQSVHYYYYGPERRRIPLLTITDSMALDQTLYAFSNFIMGNPFFLTRPVDRSGSGFGRTRSGTGLDPEEIAGLYDQIEVGKMLEYLNPEDNEQMYQLGDLQNRLLDSIYAPMLWVKNRLLIFDHAHDELIQVSGAEMDLSRSPLSYHRASKGWQKEVLHDAATGKVYGLFSTSLKGFMLQEINLAQGKGDEVYFLGTIPTISSHFKVRNGIAYFIGQPDVTIPNKFLYRVRLGSRY